MKMQNPIPEIDPNYLVYAGAVGICLGLGLLIYFLYRRTRWIIQVLSKDKGASPGLLASLRNLVMITIWISLFGMVLFVGFFLRAYHAFTFEEPVAEIIIHALGDKPASKTLLVELFCAHSQKTRYLMIRGDQWMIEGDILKWDNWLNFLGLHTRYRLTRLRGRYMTTEAEIEQARTIHSLVDDENDPFWRYLYRYGPQLPFVSTVYGNAAYQASGENKHYLIFVGTSGFVVREKEGK